MNAILHMLAKVAYKYGKEGAGMPSFRGIYEMEVPSELVEYVNAEISDSNCDQFAL